MEGEANANRIQFDFLGKDSIRYVNDVAVEPKVYELIKSFCRVNKSRGESSLAKHDPHESSL